MTLHPLQPLLELGDQTPLDVASKLAAEPGMVFFDSARENGPCSQISILAARPLQRVDGYLDNPHDLHTLREAHRRLQMGGRGTDRGLPHAILAGTVDYDGRFDFALYPEPLIFEHSSQRWHGKPGGTLLRRLPTLPEQNLTDHRINPPHFKGHTTKETFCKWVLQAQEYIRAGDIYQVNLTHQLHSEYREENIWPLYESLRHHSPAPYAAFLRQKDRTILSSSPELFLKISGQTIQTRPIKGTRPRRSDPLADERSAFDLLTSAKEISELIMITDLERNDLGQVCEWGSVAVRELLKLERHEQVFHLVSTVEGRLRPEVDAVLALKACFPGGSITGAPKIRAREIIHEIEPQPRGLYTGAIGWLGSGGESQLNIAIRTLIHEGQRLHFHVGAGIVADSIPEHEWQETWDKASGILLACERVGLDADGRTNAAANASEVPGKLQKNRA